MISCNLQKPEFEFHICPNIMLQYGQLEGRANINLLPPKVVKWAYVFVFMTVCFKTQTQTITACGVAALWVPEAN